MHRGMYIYIYRATLKTEMKMFYCPLRRERALFFGGIKMADKKLKPREQAFIITFEKLFNPELSVEEIVANASECESVTLNEKAANMAKGVDANLEEIDKLIEANLRGWSKSRISKVALAVLRLGVYELKIAEKPAPVGVIISEAVNICKDYGSDEDKSFVNGVLGSVSRA